MGFRFRKSIQIAKGVRLNVSKGGIGVSAGVRGARYSVHSSGRRTKSAGLPGTGLSFVSTSGRGRSRAASGPSSRQTQPVPVAQRPAKPGLFAPASEKALYKALDGGRLDVAGLAGVARTHGEYWIVAVTLAGLRLAQDPATHAEARRWLAEAFASGHDPTSHPFVEKYLQTQVTTPIAPGVTAQLPISRDAIGLELAELHQDAGDLDAAIDVVEQLEPTAHAAVSLAELYLQAGRLDDVIDLTNEVKNVDDATALLLTYRGTALREQGHWQAAREAFKAALKSRSRASEIRHLALSERAETFRVEGKRAQARKDLERILADNADYPGLHHRLAQLS